MRDTTHFLHCLFGDSAIQGVAVCLRQQQKRLEGPFMHAISKCEKPENKLSAGAIKALGRCIVNNAEKLRFHTEQHQSIHQKSVTKLGLKKQQTQSCK